MSLKSLKYQLVTDGVLKPQEYVTADDALTAAKESSWDNGYECIKVVAVVLEVTQETNLKITTFKA